MVVVVGGVWCWVVGVSGKPLETTGDHRVQIPQTIFGLVSRIYAPSHAASTPKATLAWGNIRILIYKDNICVVNI